MRKGFLRESCSIMFSDPHAKPASMLPLLRQWLLGCTMIYATLFGSVKVIYGDTLTGVGLLVIACVAGKLLARSLSETSG